MTRPAGISAVTVTPVAFADPPLLNAVGVQIAAIRALRTAFADTPLRLDPNACWSPTTSIEVAAETDGLLEYLEDPTAGIAGMAEVAAATRTPLATNMCVVCVADIEPAIRANAVGVILADHHFWGGLRGCQRLSAVCDAFGIGVSMHSNSHLGISLAAMTQLAAATPTLTYACDTHTPWQDGVDVVTQPLSFVDGAVPVPDTPGLGVELDGDALARLHETYLRCGIRTRDDAGYFRSVQPDFRPRRPKW